LKKAHSKKTNSTPASSFGSEALIERLERLSQASSGNHQSWMIQLSPETKTLWERDFLATLKPEKSTFPLGGDFYTLTFHSPLSSAALLGTIFPRWCCPLQHQWPVNPRSEKFVERAAAGIQHKLGLSWSQLQILSTSPELKRIAVGLKGRLLQMQMSQQPHDQNVLVVLVHAKGICAGLSTGAIELGSALSGGLGFLKNPKDQPSTAQATQNAQTTETDQSHPAKPERTSRAAGKITEVLMLLKELGISSTDFPTWLELGAAPGGMTQELVNWGAQVTAVDLAELAPHMVKNPKVTLWKMNANEIRSAEKFSAILCDMNGPTQNSAQIVAHLLGTLLPGSLLIHTLKVTQLNLLKNSIEAVCALFEEQGARVLAVRHLFHNRTEVTVIAVKLRAHA